jgi:carboxyl-terminal processing protease
MVDTANQVGYIRLTTFTETSASDLDEILTRLEKEGLNGLILDLRYNPGGYLNSAAEVADLFIREGVIVKSSPRHGLATYEIAHEKGTHPDYPLVILINESSASASEIVAGALQDPKYRRATLVGQRSYGKGSVQVVSPYTGGNSQLKYTVAYYHLPSDQQVKNRYQMEKQGRKDWGVAPDVEVKMSISELREMLDKQRDNDVLVQAGHDESKAPTKRSSLQQTLDSDPQLATALLVVQSKMIRNGRTLQLPSDPNSFVIKEQE